MVDDFRGVRGVHHVMIDVCDKLSQRNPLVAQSFSLEDSEMED